MNENKFGYKSSKNINNKELTPGTKVNNSVDYGSPSKKEFLIKPFMQ